jgi:hypothetical protein
MSRRPHKSDLMPGLPRNGKSAWDIHSVALSLEQTFVPRLY